jgi:hypothetical protein
MKKLPRALCELLEREGRIYSSLRTARRVFISSVTNEFNSPDSPDEADRYCDQLGSELMKCGFEVVNPYDLRDIETGGKEIFEKLRDLIWNCDYFISLIGTEAGVELGTPDPLVAEIVFQSVNTGKPLRRIPVRTVCQWEFATAHDLTHRTGWPKLLVISKFLGKSPEESVEILQLEFAQFFAGDLNALETAAFNAETLALDVVNSLRRLEADYVRRALLLLPEDLTRPWNDHHLRFCRERQIEIGLLADTAAGTDRAADLAAFLKKADYHPICLEIPDSFAEGFRHSEERVREPARAGMAAGLIQSRLHRLASAAQQAAEAVSPKVTAGKGLEVPEEIKNFYERLSLFGASEDLASLKEYCTDKAGAKPCPPFVTYLEHDKVWDRFERADKTVANLEGHLGQLIAPNPDKTKSRPYLDQRLRAHLPHTDAERQAWGWFSRIHLTGKGSIPESSIAPADAEETLKSISANLRSLANVAQAAAERALGLGKNVKVRMRSEATAMGINALVAAPWLVLLVEDASWQSTALKEDDWTNAPSTLLWTVLAKRASRENTGLRDRVLVVASEDYEVRLWQALREVRESHSGFGRLDENAFLGSRWREWEDLSDRCGTHRASGTWRLVTSSRQRMAESVVRQVYQMRVLLESGRERDERANALTNQHASIRDHLSFLGRQFGHWTIMRVLLAGWLASALLAGIGGIALLAPYWSLDRPWEEFLEIAWKVPGGKIGIILIGGALLVAILACSIILWGLREPNEDARGKSLRLQS